MARKSETRCRVPPAKKDCRDRERAGMVPRGRKVIWQGRSWIGEKGESGEKGDRGEKGEAGSPGAG